jgi:sugar O-acyltransferase (sialic acid O-acetyltransferase NeuD family)
MPPIRPLLIPGIGRFAAEIADLAFEIPRVQTTAFVENMDPQRCHETMEGLPIIWVEEVAQLAHSHWAVCGLGTTHRKRFAEQVSERGIPFATLVHPSARISSSSTLGDGTIVSVGSIIASNTRLGQHTLVNRGDLIGHHTDIGRYVSIGPGANIARSCRIGPSTCIGMGAVVIDHITIQGSSRQ